MEKYNLTKRERMFLDLGIQMALAERGRIEMTETDMLEKLLAFGPSLSELSALDDFVQLLLDQILLEG